MKPETKVVDARVLASALFAYEPGVVCWPGVDARSRRELARRWLRRVAPSPAIVPFADKVAERTKTDAIRVRRDFNVVMELTMASAVLNKVERSTDAEGRLLATTQDYASALSAAFGQSVAAQTARQAFPSAEAIKANG